MSVRTEKPLLRGLRWAVPLAAAGLVAACSSGSSSGSSGGSPPPSSSVASTPAGHGGGYGNYGGASSSAPAAAKGAASTIKTRTTSLGTFLTDNAGRSIYLWAADHTDKSTCSGACVSAWPPVPATGSVTVAGAAVQKDVGTTTRSDGTKQLTYAGHPLYYYAGDSGTATSGQGSTMFGAPWWLVTPSGTAITK
jgi:predicted lipoprotein with Yx(FWY)xxD motif